MPHLFGKQYEWDVVNGQLRLVKPWILPVPDPGPFTYDKLMSELGRIEAEGGGEWYGIEEGQEWISLAGQQHDALQSEVGGDGEVSDIEQSGDMGAPVARSQGHGEEGAGGEAQPVLRPEIGTCTSCWFDSHSGCAGPRRCGCSVCYDNEEQSDVR